MARTHVAIVDPRYADLILAGKKTAEVRLSRTRRAPFGVIAPGDEILFRVRSGWYAARARSDRVACVELGSPADLRGIRLACGTASCAPPEFWRDRSAARYATVAWLTGVEPTRAGPAPRSLAAPGCRSAWFVVDPSNTRRVCEPGRAGARAGAQ